MELENLIMGIDPGKMGSITFLSDGQPLAYKMPETERDLFDLIEEYAPNVKKCYLEKVASMPNQGVKSVWTFSGNYHGIRMALIACKVPFETIPPGNWQRSLGCLTKGDKNITKRKAQELFPDLKITHAIADGLLIAEYGRRKEKS